MAIQRRKVLLKFAVIDQWSFGILAAAEIHDPECADQRDIGWERIPLNSEVSESRRVQFLPDATSSDESAKSQLDRMFRQVSFKEPGNAESVPPDVAKDSRIGFLQVCL